MRSILCVAALVAAVGLSGCARINGSCGCGQGDILLQAAPTACGCGGHSATTSCGGETGQCETGGCATGNCETGACPGALAAFKTATTGGCNSCSAAPRRFQSSRLVGNRGMGLRLTDRGLACHNLPKRVGLFSDGFRRLDRGNCGGQCGSAAQDCGCSAPAAQPAPVAQPCQSCETHDVAEAKPCDTCETTAAPAAQPAPVAQPCQSCETHDVAEAKPCDTCETTATPEVVEATEAAPCNTCETTEAPEVVEATEAESCNTCETTDAPQVAVTPEVEPCNECEIDEVAEVTPQTLPPIVSAKDVCSDCDEVASESAVEVVAAASNGGLRDRLAARRIGVNGFGAGRLNGCGVEGCGRNGMICRGCAARKYGLPPYGGVVPHTIQQPGQSGIAPSYAYPYYTTRGPRDFLNPNPPSIGY